MQVSTLVVAQPKGDQVGPEVLSAVGAAKAIGGDITILLAGKDIASAAKYASHIQDVGQVIIRGMLEAPVRQTYTK